MKCCIKVTIKIIGVVLLLCICIICGFCIKNYIDDKMFPVFDETTIFPNGNLNPSDTVLNVNGIEFRMVGIRGGKVCCEGLRDTINLNDFYIAEREATQKLWTAVMGINPSCNQECDSLPVENIDLLECMEFVHRLDSISGLDFFIPSYPQWVYAANMGNRDSLRIYDMVGNVSEWTVSGSDPLFYVLGGSRESDMEHCAIDHYEICHAKIKERTIGLRLIYTDK